MFRRNQPDDDPFAALNEANKRGSTTISSGTASPSSGDGAGAGPASDSAFGAAPAGVPGTPKRRSNAPLVLLTLLLAFGAAGALVHFSTSPADTADADGAYFTGPQRTDETSAGDERPREETKPRPQDLVQAAGFADALARIQNRLQRGERVWLLRVARDDVNALTRTRDGDQRSINVSTRFGIRVNDAGSAGSHRGMPLGRISPLAPAAAVRNAARQARVSPRQFDYMVMSTPLIPGDGRRPDWQVFFRDVPDAKRQWVASLDGRTVGLPGWKRTTTTSSLTITTNGKTRTITGAQAQRIVDCVRRAGTDGARIRRCLP
jgi:hypothetical protein